MKTATQITAMKIMLAKRFKCEALDDNGIYIYRFHIPSKSNPTKKYVVSFNRQQREWQCGCPGWTTRHVPCIHLKSMHSALKTAFDVG